MSDRSIQVRAGFGERVRTRMAALGLTQAQLAAECDVSRQTISRALNKDEVSDRTASRIEHALANVDGEALSGDANGTQRGTIARLSSAALVDATDLVAWADRRDAQSLLPLVVRRLILETGRQVTEIHFRSGEGVQLGGWDGISRTAGASPFIPEGESGWEMGVGRAIKAKAEDDLSNRTESPAPLDPTSATFVFVTPRRWVDKEEWAAERTDQGPWRRVRVIDADDLAAWLSVAPATHVWLSLLLGKTPPGVFDLEAFWREWSEATNPPFTTQLLSAGRDSAMQEIRERITRGDKAFAVRSESREESAAAVFAAMSGLPAGDLETLLARSVVVHSSEALRPLVASPSRLLIVPMFDGDELVASAARAGHSVVVPLGAADPEPDTPSSVVGVPPISRTKAADLLEGLGIEHDRRYQVAGLLRRSPTAYRRTVAANPSLRQPDWAKASVARTLLPALLVGSWNEAREADREALAEIARRPYEELRDVMIGWAEVPDPPIRRRGDAWYLVSREDSWSLISRFLTRDDLDRMERVALRILGTVDPSFDLPPDQRWMAGALGHSSEYSSMLVRGLADSIAIMGARGSHVPSATYSAEDCARRIVGELLERANADWRLWATLSRHLPLLAEAAPEEFMDAVETGLTGDDPPLGHLFADDRTMMCGSSPHTGLLWALETVAWSNEQLSRVVRCLAALDQIDPGSELRATGDRTGRLTNRPLASLRAIFRSWLPETSALLQQRLRVLDSLRGWDDVVAWDVMISMLPEHHASAFPSARPTYREWAADARRYTSPTERAATTAEVMKRLRSDAGLNGDRWAQLVERLALLPGDERERVMEDLSEIDISSLGASARVAIWTSLREFVARHRNFRGADWAMPEEYLGAIGDLRERFAPSDPIDLHAWLFDYHPRIAGPTDEGESSWEVQQAALADERTRAVQAVVEAKGTNGLERLVSTVTLPFEVGLSAGRSDALEDPDVLLSAHLADDDPGLAALARGYLVGRMDLLGPDWAKELLDRRSIELTAAQEGDLLTTLPAEPSTWELAAARGPETEMEYWRRVRVYSISSDNAARASEALRNAGRPFSAVELLAHVQRGEINFPPDTIAAALEGVVTYQGEVERPTSHFRYTAARLLDALAASDFDRSRVARVEWALLPIVDSHEREPSALQHLLAESPEFFVEVVSLVYRAEDEEAADLSPEDQQRWRTAHTLLDSFRKLPGQDGTRVDSSAFRAWLRTVREALKAAGREQIGLHVIGQMLSGSPSDQDGNWPCLPVREVLEEWGSDSVEEGLRIGVFNSRGVVTRDPSAGGASERALAERYEGLAAAVVDAHPRTGRVLRRIADTYRRHGRREDHESEMLEDLGL